MQKMLLSLVFALYGDKLRQNSPSDTPCFPSVFSPEIAHPRRSCPLYGGFYHSGAGYGKHKITTKGGANILLNTGFGVLPLCPGDADHFLHKISILKTMADIIADAILASNSKPQSV